MQGKVTSAKLQSIEMNQSGNDVRTDRLNIQRAQSAVLVEKDGVQYAVVTDDNYNFLDPYWKAMFEAPDFVQLTPFGPRLGSSGERAPHASISGSVACNWSQPAPIAWATAVTTRKKLLALFG